MTTHAHRKGEFGSTRRLPKGTAKNAAIEAKANAQSAKAKKLSALANHGTGGHNIAAEHHVKAAEMHEKIGNRGTAKYHEKKAEEHMRVGQKDSEAIVNHMVFATKFARSHSALADKLSAKASDAKGHYKAAEQHAFAAERHESYGGDKATAAQHRAKEKFHRSKVPAGFKAPRVRNPGTPF